MMPLKIRIEDRSMEHARNIPTEMKEYSNWVVWKYEQKDGRQTKIPYDPKGTRRASSTDPSTWASFDKASQACDNGSRFDGVGFVFTEKDPYFGVDLDKCVRDGVIEEWAQEIVDRFNTYAEFTPSDTGIHIIGKGKLPGTGIHAGKIELYDLGRYFTVTGHHLPSSPGEIQKCQEALDRLIKEIIPEPKEPAIAPSVSRSCLSDDQVIERASTSENQDKFKKLWEGDFSEYPSQSEAEFALCTMLAFWCKKDLEQVDRLFRQSKLMRAKWDEKHGQKTYGQMTIEKTAAITTETFRPSKVEEKKEQNPKPNAWFPDLVDLVDHDGKIAFLIHREGKLEVQEQVEMNGSLYVPPPRENLKWMLPRADEVLRYYEKDSPEDLYTDLIAYHKSISELPSDYFYMLLALWDLHSYLHDKFEYSPILWLYAVPERGKTRTGKGIAHVAWRTVHIEALREANILRYAQDQRASLFFDVFDLWKKAEHNNAEDLLLHRFEKGMTVARVLYPDRGPHQDMVNFEIYGPTFCATNEPVPEVLATRAIQIIMPESMRHFEDDVKPEKGLSLKERLVAFRARYIDAELPQAGKPCRGRLGDILRPLRQIGLLVCPDDEDPFFKLVQIIQGERSEAMSDTLPSKVVSAIYDLRGEIFQGRLSVSSIADRVNEDIPDRYKYSNDKIGRVLKALGYRRERSGQVRYILCDPITNDSLFSRYIPHRIASQASQASQPTEETGKKL